jgi:thioredoxin reductase (NADPH)
MVKNIYSAGTSHYRIKHYDILIIGGGPAGLTAALYAARYGLAVALVAKKIGGTASTADLIENWPGFVGSGYDLMEKFKKQAEDSGARFLEAGVDSVTADDNGFVFKIGEEEIHGKSVIIALGREKKRLDLKGEKELLGKGVSHCATCDANFFKGREVAVVGGGDSAAKSALQLADIVKKVSIIYRREELRAEEALMSKIRKSRKIKIYNNSIVTKISGKEKVDHLHLETTVRDKKGNEKVEKSTLEVSGVFIEIGSSPIHAVVDNLHIDNNDYSIITDKEAKTSVPGVFAAGDNTDGKLKQVVTAAGEGAQAAKSAYDYLRFEYDKDKK